MTSDSSASGAARVAYTLDAIHAFTPPSAVTARRVRVRRVRTGGAHTALPAGELAERAGLSVTVDEARAGRAVPWVQAEAALLHGGLAAAVDWWAITPVQDRVADLARVDVLLDTTRQFVAVRDDLAVPRVAAIALAYGIDPRRAARTVVRSGQRRGLADRLAELDRHGRQRAAEQVARLGPSRPVMVWSPDGPLHHGRVAWACGPVATDVVAGRSAAVVWSPVPAVARARLDLVSSAVVAGLPDGMGRPHACTLVEIYDPSSGGIAFADAVRMTRDLVGP